MEFFITGVNEIIQKEKEDPDHPARIKLEFHIDDLGILDLRGATLVTKNKIVIPKTKEVVEEEVKEETEGTEKEEPVEETEPEMEIKFEDVVHELKIEKRYYNPRPLNDKESKESIKKLDKLDKHENEIARLNEEKDKFEGLIYSSRDWLAEPENEVYLTLDKNEEINTYLEEV